MTWNNQIKITARHKGQKVFEKIFSEGPVFIGRDPACQIYLNYSFISRKHARIEKDQNFFCIEDLGSSNGIVLGSQKVPTIKFDKNFSFKISEINFDVELLQCDQDFEKTVVGPVELSGRAAPVAARIPRGIPENVGREAVSLQQSNQDQHEPKGGRAAILAQDFHSDLIGLHTDVGGTAKNKLETVVMWNGQVYDVFDFNSKQKVFMGSHPLADLRLSILPKVWAMAHIGFDSATCFIPVDCNARLRTQNSVEEISTLVENQSVKQKGKRNIIKLTSKEVLQIDLSPSISFYMRFVPTSQTLPRRRLVEPDYQIKRALIVSLVAHGLLGLALIILAPESKNVPQIKNVPERFARLLVEAPRPIIPLPPPPPPVVIPKPVKPLPRKQEVVHEEKRVKPMPPVKRIVKNLPKRSNSKVTDRFTRAPRKEVATAAVPEVKVESLGALSALGGMSLPTDSAPITDIQINKNAGGAESKVMNPAGVVGNLKSSGGKLLAGGSGPIKTGGKGIGAGKEYGMQGLSGGSGKRNIGGSVVGKPKLASVAAEEGLTRQQVWKEIEKKQGEIQACYEKSLLSKPDLMGRIEFEWDIQAAGNVTGVRVKRSTVPGGEQLSECVKAIFAGMKFPKAKNGQSTTPSIGFPFGRI